MAFQLGAAAPGVFITPSLLGPLPVTSVGTAVTGCVGSSSVKVSDVQASGTSSSVSQNKVTLSGQTFTVDGLIGKVFEDNAGSVFEILDNGADWVLLAKFDRPVSGSWAIGSTVPKNEIIEITGLEAYEDKFGDQDDGADMYYAVKGFFDNQGGKILLVNIEPSDAGSTELETGTAASGGAGYVIDETQTIAQGTLLGAIFVQGANKAVVSSNSIMEGSTSQLGAPVLESGLTKSHASGTTRLVGLAHDFDGAAEDDILKQASGLIWLVTGVDVDGEWIEVADISNELSLGSSGNLDVLNPASKIEFDSGTTGVAGAYSVKNAVVQDTDFEGSDADLKGMHALNVSREINLLMIPGRCTEIVQSAAIDYADGRGDIFVILSVPEDESVVADAVSWVQTTVNKPSKYVAWYYNWLEVTNPSTSEAVIVDPAGHIAGMFARTDGSARGGVAHAPAGVRYGQMLGATDVQIAYMDEVTLYNARINPIVTRTGLGIYVNGAQTTSTDTRERLIQVIRTVLFIGESLDSVLINYVFENNDYRTRESVERTCVAFLRNMLSREQLAGKSDDEAFRVICDETNNSEADVANGVLNVTVAVKPQRAVEFLVISLQFPLSA